MKNLQTMKKTDLSQILPCGHTKIELDGGKCCLLIEREQSCPYVAYEILLENFQENSNNLPSVIFTALNDGNRSIKVIEDKSFNLTGYCSQELLIAGKDIYNSLINVEDIPQLTQKIDQAITEQMPYKAEYRIITKSGQEKWILEQGQGIYNRLGKIEQIQGCLTDITHCKEIEQSLGNIEKHYWLLAENATELITLHAPSGHYRYISPICQSLLGYKPEIFYNSFPDQLCHPEDKSKLKQFYNSLKIENHLSSIIYRIRHSQGHYIWLETQAKVIPNSETGKIEEIVCVSHEVTKQQQVEEALQQAANQYHTIFEYINYGIFQTSKDGHYLTANPALAKLYGYDSPVDLINNLTYVDQQLYVNPKQREALMKLLEKKGQVSNFESQVYRKDGSTIWISENTRAIYSQQGHFLYYEGTVEDITDRRQTEAKLYKAAYHDSLTQLPNRVWFSNQFEQVMRCNLCKSNKLFGVLFIGLDGFKHINESWGHCAGDKLLKLVALRLKQTIRDADRIARFAGDKFVVLLADHIQSLDDITQIADRILENFRLPFVLEKETLFMRVSIGITTSKMDYQKTEDVLRDSEVAMYQAKVSGKNCYMVFDQTMRQTALSRLQLENDLRQAIEKKEFILYYQPIIELKQGQLVGFEALIRWHHPIKGWISPVDFIPIAEETGLINEIGWWVTEEACRQLYYWQKEYPHTFPLKMNINLSTYQLTQKNLVGQIENILQQTQVEGKDIKLEITESCFLETIGSDIEKIEAIKRLGIELCIDDFGTGYSSLNRLHEFPIDTLKIDRTFTQRLESHPTTIIQIIVTLAHTLGMDVVAEGIETDQQLQQLKAVGCEYGQGYLFSRPVNGETACQFFEEDNLIQQYFKG
ncbi:MAG: EAL domain-containing protein [Microcystaceae cyanobacterium]